MRNFNFIGCTAPAGIQYIGFHPDDRLIWLPKSSFTDPRSIAAVCSEHQMVIPDSKTREAFLKGVSAVDDFPVRDMLENIGWNGRHYLHSDGTVVVPEGGRSAELSSMIRLTEPMGAGSLYRWRKHVVRRLAGNPLAIFSVVLPFAAPLLKLSNLPISLVFEVVGKQAIGKSTLQRLAVSVMGSPDLSASNGFWATHLEASQNTASLAARFNDHAIILDSADTASIGQSPKAKKDVYRAIAFDLARHANGGQQCAFSSSNEALNVWLGNEGQTAADKEHVITLRVDDDRPFGVFDQLPDGTKSAGDFADELMNVVAANHGLPFRRYMQWLVNWNERDPEGLQCVIRERLETFRRHVGADGSDGRVRRRADAFGLVYVAATFARECRALPVNPDLSNGFYGKALIECYRLHLKSVPSTVSLPTRLEGLINDPRCLMIGEPVDDEKEAIRAAPWILQKKPGGSELLVKSRSVSDAFPDWQSLKLTDEFAAGIDRDVDHLKKKKCVQGVDIGRVYVFPIRDKLTTEMGIFDS